MRRRSRTRLVHSRPIAARLALKQKLTASDGAADHKLGASVAIDGDTIVVGAWGDDSAKGSASVFFAAKPIPAPPPPPAPTGSHGLGLPATAGDGIRAHSRWASQRAEK